MGRTKEIYIDIETGQIRMDEPYTIEEFNYIQQLNEANVKEKVLQSNYEYVLQQRRIAQ